VDRKRNIASEQSLVDLLGEETFPAKIGQRRVQNTVTARRNDTQVGGATLRTVMFC
jgi:hypothetical protein